MLDAPCTSSNIPDLLPHLRPCLDIPALFNFFSLSVAAAVYPADVDPGS